MDLYSDFRVNDTFMYYSTSNDGDDDTSTVVYYHAAGRASTTSGCELSVYRQLFIIHSSAYTLKDKNLMAISIPQ